MKTRHEKGKFTSAATRRIKIKVQLPWEKGERGTGTTLVPSAGAEDAGGRWPDTLQLLLSRQETPQPRLTTCALEGCVLCKCDVWHAPWIWLPHSAAEDAAELHGRSFWFFFFDSLTSFWIKCIIGVSTVGEGQFQTAKYKKPAHTFQVFHEPK